MAGAEDRLEPDAIEGIPLPRERAHLTGHRAGETTLLDAYRGGRLHHAWLVMGLRGVGKATLAFRFARFLAAHPEPGAPAIRAASDLAVDPAHPQARRIAAAAHPEVLHLRRAWDEQGKRFRSELTVAEIRRTVGFFGTTAAAGGWRIAIVDAADDMNASAANALLKILEEPPPRSVFLVLAHSPGAVIATIRSRCRRLALQPLAAAEIEAVLAEIAPDRGEPAERRAAAVSGEGSVRRALQLLAGDGLAIRARVAAITARLPRPPSAEIHALAESVTGKGREEAWEIFRDAMHEGARTAMREALGELGRAAAWAEADTRLSEIFRTTDIYNLDRRSAVLAAVRTLAEAARHPLSPGPRPADGATTVGAS